MFKVPGFQILDRVYPVNTSSVLPGVLLEGHADKLYTHHLKAYGLEAVNNFLRGTLRYQVKCMMLMPTNWGRKSNGYG